MRKYSSLAPAVPADPTTFGGTVQRLRLERGLTLSAAARGTLLHNSSLRGMEAGKFTPTLHTAGEAAKGLGMMLSEVVAAWEKNQRAASTQTPV